MMFVALTHGIHGALRPLAPDHAHHFACIQRGRAGPDVAQVLLLQGFAAAQKALVGLAQQVGGHDATACVIAFGQMAERVSAGK